MHAVAHDQHPVVDTRGVAQPGEGVAHPAEVELHGEGVDPDGDGPVLDEPERHLRLVGGQLHAAGHPHRHPRPVELARLVRAVIAVVSLGLEATELLQGLVSVLHQS